MKTAASIASLLLPLLAATPLLGGDSPEIAFEQKDHDFGKVQQGEDVVHNFVFSNKGGGDLRIEGVKSSCGCTTALISDKTVPPGGTGEIKATFSTRGRRGTQRKTISVTTNDPEKNRVTLSLGGEIVVPLTLEPPRLSFRDVLAGEGQSSTVRVILADDWKECLITDIISTNPHIEGRVDRADLSKKKRGFLTSLAGLFRRGEEKEEAVETTLHVRIQPDAPKGRIHGRINLKYEGESKGEAVLPVYARVVGNIGALPERLSMGSIPPEEGKEMSFVVSDRRGRDLTLESIETGSDFISATQQPVDASSTRIIVRVKPGAPEGALRGLMKMRTGDSGEPVVEVPYSGQVRTRGGPG